MAELIMLRLEGPLQSWGELSKWDSRESSDMPTRSGIVGLLASAMIACNSTSGDEDLQVMGESLPVVVIDSSMVGQKHEVLYTIEGEDSVTTDSVTITEDMVGDCLEYPDSGSALWKKIEELKKQKAVKK